MESGFYAEVAANPHPLLGDIAAANQVMADIVTPIVIAPQMLPDVTTVDLQGEIGRMAEEGVEESVSEEVFLAYKHRDILPGCRPHPGEIVEPGSLGALSLPPAYYPLKDSLPREVITSGKLSSLQLEGILYACQRHQIVLPSGCRAGFFMGDGAGVGKGRQVAGIILDNCARGRTKHVWFSISSDLIVDATRDLSDISCYVRVINGCHQLDKETRVFGLPTDFKEGVVFSTYATLVSSVQKGGTFGGTKQSRLQQLVNWCGGQHFDGCLIFDECHKAKNFLPGKESTSTKVALAVATIQRMLPQARVVYCSATGVTDVKNMAFMERLGLWGKGAAFKSFEQFLDTIQKKGLGVAELLAMEMKSSGVYVSRGLSFQEAEFVNMEVRLDEKQKKMYDTAAHLWGEVQRSLDVAVQRTCSTNSRIWSNFWAAHQRFFKQLCLGMKVPAIVAEAKAILDSGHCVVIGLQTTGEASLDSEVNKCGISGLVDFVSLCREILTRFIEQSFPVTNENQNVAQPVDDWCCTAKQMLLSFAKRIELPNSPLDDIIDRLGGPGYVAEMTGRRGRIVRRSQTSQPQYELRDKDSSGNLESINVTERNLFMQGSKLVAIISDAASTGISLHADLRVGNQRRRVHLTLELPWSADKAVQQLGRSHRSNQSSGPLYKLITTDLGGERRFASAVAKRLQSLGALTKGDRRAATGADLTEFNFDTPYGRTALRTMYNAICRNIIVPGIALTTVAHAGQDFAAFNAELHECLASMGVLEAATLTDLPKVKDKESCDVGKFLNRILGLSVERQNLIFNYFSKSLSAQVSNAKKEGKYSEGLVDITASSVNIVGEPKEVFKANTSSSNPTRHFVLNIDRGMSWQMALQRLANYDTSADSPNGFYCSRRDHKGKRWLILATQKHEASHLFKIARPNTGVSSFEEEKTDLLHKYMPISVDKAEAGWTEQYNSTRERCIHGPQCRSGSACTVGARCYRMHLLCGGIVTMLSLLETTLARYGPQLQLTKAESTMRVIRVQLENGERLVGVRYPHSLLHLVEKAIDERRMMELAQKMQQQQMNLLQQQLEATATQSVCSDSVPADHMASVDGNDSLVSSHVITTSTTEPVTSVNKKCLLKATTPPVTIKHFFKSAKMPPSNTERNNSNDASDRNNSNDAAGVELTAKRTTNAPVSDGNKSKLMESKSVKRPLMANCGNQSKSKRVKQTSIVSLFARGKSQQGNDDQKQQRQCPVCGEEFHTDLSNAKINKHIDTCLIE